MSRPPEHQSSTTDRGRHYATEHDQDVEAIQDRTSDLLRAFPPGTTAPQEFLGAQFDAGLAWVGFPRTRGRLGLAPGLQAVVDRQLEASKAPDPHRLNPVGHGMAAPTIAEFGSDEQASKWLRPLFTGEHIWCQLFSEPDAGSDVASVATSATRHGRDWVLRGHKVWSTLAHNARWATVLARTDPEAPKHKGLTYFILDMHQPGVEVRPLRQLTGDAEFNEVYLDDASVPDCQRVGAVGEGWRVAITNLMNERVSIGGETPSRGSGPIAEALRLWWIGRPGGVRADNLMRLWIRSEVLRLTNARAVESRTIGSAPGPEGSIGKLMYAELTQDVFEFCLSLMSADALLHDSYEMRRPEVALEFTNPTQSFLRSRALSIEGGTSEIMRNILGERVLGLPAEPRADKAQAWSRVPRSSASGES